MLLEDLIPIQDSLGENRRHILLELVYNYVNMFYLVSPVTREPDPDREELDRLVNLQPELKEWKENIFTKSQNRMATLSDAEIAAIQQQLRKKTQEMREIYAKLIEAGAVEVPDDYLDDVAGGW